MNICRLFLNALFSASAIIVVSAFSALSQETVTDADGNVYSTVKIGNQVWTVENLKTTKYNDGTAIPLVKANAEWSKCDDDKRPACCWYGNIDSNKTVYGALYNWYAVNTGKLAPKGWHVASDAEWIELEKYLAASGFNLDETGQDRKIGKAMAAAAGWAWGGSNIEQGAIADNPSKNNRSGFSALPGGFRLVSGNCRNAGTTGRWWTATEYDSTRAWRYNLRYESANLNRDNYLKGCGFSVRLVSDDTLLGKAPTETGTSSSIHKDEMVRIEGGTFMMGLDSGDNDDRPKHEVTVSGFYLDKTEVTQEEYKRATGNNPSIFSNCPKCPVENVSWLDAKNYCEKVGKRLPTEAEWEYACRAGSAAKYYWGDEQDDEYAWHCDNSGRKTHPVGRKKPNRWGLYDMIGNVYEWCDDRFDEKYYGKETSPDPATSSGAEMRILRGGSRSNNWDGLGCAIRVWDEPGARMNNVGFRCAR